MRYKLLSLALLGKSAKSSRSFVPLNKLLSTRCALLKRDDWSQFLVVHYARPESVGNRQVLTDDERRQLRHRKVTQLIHSGEIGKGARRLAQPEIRDGDRLSSEEMLDKLRALHPVRNPQIASLLTPEMQRELEEFQASPENHVTIDIKRLLSLKILRHKLIKGGFTKTRYEHLAALLEVNRSEQSPAARQFAEHYVRYLEMLVNGNLPDAFYGILADVEATGIQKPKASSKDIRPIGFNDIDRRLLFAYLTPIAEEETRQRFAAASQVANQPSAAEKYIFSVQAGLEACRSHDMGDLDAKAAFQKVPTDFLLYSVYKAHPWLYPFVSRVYGKHRHVFVNLDHNVYEFTASMGVTQGCVGAGYLYNLVTVPLLERIREVIYAVAAPLVGAAAHADQSQSQQSNFSYTPALSDLQGAGGRLGLSQLRQQHRRRFHAQEDRPDLSIECGASYAYYDNVTFHSVPDAFDAVMDVVLQLGPQYGYELNMSKTKVLLGARASRELALERKQQLMERYGLPDNCVRIHPDNCTDDTEKDKFGLALLGGYVGHPEFIRAGLQEKIIQLTEEKQLLIHYGRSIAK